MDAPLAVVRPLGPVAPAGGDHRLVRRLAAAPCRRELLAIGALSLVSAAATAGAPRLWDTPLLLVVLSPRLPFVVHAAASGHPGLVVAVATARLVVADPLHFRLGRGGAEASLPRVRAWVADRWLARRVRARLAVRGATAGRTALPLLVLVRPIGRHLALAGAAGTSTRLVVAADLVGTLVYVVTVVVGTRVYG